MELLLRSGDLPESVENHVFLVSFLQKMHHPLACLRLKQWPYNLIFEIKVFEGFTLYSINIKILGGLHPS